MAITREEAQEQILEELTAATDRIALAVACLGEAYELLSDDAGDRLEAEIFRPAQKAYGRAKRTHDGFAQRVDRPTMILEPPSAGRSSQGVQSFVDRAVEASGDADQMVAEIQDSMMPIEFGDAELRAGLAGVREQLSGIPRAAAPFLSTLGR